MAATDYCHIIYLPQMYGIICEIFRFSSTPKNSFARENKF